MTTVTAIAARVDQARADTGTAHRPVVAPPRERTRVVAAPSRVRRTRVGARQCAHSYQPDLRGGRLTPRGRVVVTLIWIAMIAAGFSMVAGMVSSAGEVAATSKVMVQPGDSLWQVADRVASETSLRAVVDEIVRLNGLASAHDIAPGDVLVVPVVP